MSATVGILHFSSEERLCNVLLLLVICRASYASLLAYLIVKSVLTTECEHCNGGPVQYCLYESDN